MLEQFEAKILAEGAIFDWEGSEDHRPDQFEQAGQEGLPPFLQQVIQSGELLQGAHAPQAEPSQHRQEHLYPKR